jgi:uncharacterized protein (DUF58 family)
MSPAAKAVSNARLSDLLDARFMARLDRLDVLSRKILAGRRKGERRSKRRGQSVEFADHRQYAHGDDLRFLDWNIYGRLDQLFLKLFLEEQDLSLHILVDVSGSTALGDPAKTLALKRLAAALGYVGLVHNNRVSVACFADGLTGQMSGMRGRKHAGPMASLLVSARAEGPSRFEAACRQWAAARLGSGVTVVLSDFLFKEGYEAGLKRLVSDQFDLCAIQVLSPQERRPELIGDLRLVDTEDGDAAEVTVTAPLVKAYQRNLAAWCTGIKTFCARRGATYVLTDSAQSVERLVLEQLRHARLLG